MGKKNISVNVVIGKQLNGFSEKYNKLSMCSDNVNESYFKYDTSKKP